MSVVSVGRLSNCNTLLLIVSEGISTAAICVVHRLLPPSPASTAASYRKRLESFESHHHIAFPAGSPPPPSP
ncbi:hypothetical protein Scep_005532 [Stephania cephalantha]|uniref:Uncharacterized protein n=1 Tax=Stephania cephalantha TaxID=152367 RepID=A0AAP0KVX6_9MAGN